MAGGTRIEKRSIDYVPLAERHGKVWHLWPVWFSGDAHLATLAVGSIAAGLELANQIWIAGGMKQISVIVLPPSLAVAMLAVTVMMCVGAAMISIKKVTRLDPGMVFR